MNRQAVRSNLIQEVAMHRPTRTPCDWLAVSATAFLAANLLHSADHLRQHLAGVDVAVFVGGTMLTALAVVVFRLRRHSDAPMLATAVGFTGAVLVAASHIAPHWSTLSDSYITDIHADVMSWAVMLLEVAAGFLLGVVGMHELHARARGTHDRGPLPGGSVARAAKARDLSGRYVGVPTSRALQAARADEPQNS
jgi:hypothetical protein